MINAASLNPARLCNSQFVGLTPTSIIINPGGKGTLLTGLWLTNSGATVNTVVIYRVPASGGSIGTPGNSNKLGMVRVPANDSKWVEFKGPGVILESVNDTIQIVSLTAADTVAVSADGCIGDLV
jgi:hypothetical protein